MRHCGLGCEPDGIARELFGGVVFLSSIFGAASEKRALRIQDCRLGGHSIRISRVKSQRPIDHFPSDAEGSGIIVPPHHGLGVQQQVLRVRVLGPPLLQAALLSAFEPDAQRLSNHGGNLALDLKHVADRSIVNLRPALDAARAIDELGSDTDGP